MIGQELNLKGHSSGLQPKGKNKGKAKVGNQPVWRIKEGGDARPSTSGSQST